MTMIGRVARSVSSKSPPNNWFLKQFISPQIHFSRSPPTTNPSDKGFSIRNLRDVNIIAFSRPQTGDSIVNYIRLRRRLQDSSKMENDKHKPIFYVHRESRGCTLLTPVSVGDDGSLSNKYSISLPFETVLDPGTYYSCNGLFCYRDRTCDEHELFVWNPTTMETRKLPISPHTFEPPKDTHCIYNEVTVPFDTLTKVDEFVATWADPQSEDYKLLRYYTFHDYNHVHSCESFDHFCPTQLELYSLKTDCWKKLCWEEGPDYGISRCYIDGVIYMLPNNVDYRSVILSFDFRTETFSTIPFPTPGCHRSSYELLNCNGQLSLLRFRHNFPYAIVEMDHWVMSNGEWDCVSRYHDVCGVFRPLGFARNGELLLFESVDHLEPELHLSLMVFDSATRVIKHLPGLASRCYISLFHFAETFVKLKPSGEQEKEDGRAIQEQILPEEVEAELKETSVISMGTIQILPEEVEAELKETSVISMGTIQIFRYSRALQVSRTSSYHSQASPISYSEYELHDLLFPRNNGCGLFEILFTWPLSCDDVRVPHNVLGMEFYFHGPRCLKIPKFKFDWLGSSIPQTPPVGSIFQSCSLDGYYVLSVWPDMKYPSLLPFCKSFVLYQWMKHGRRFYIDHVEYVMLGIHFAESFIGDYFGLTPGRVMSSGEVLSCVFGSIQQKKISRGLKFDPPQMPFIYVVEDTSDPSLGIIRDVILQFLKDYDTQGWGYVKMIGGQNTFRGPGRNCLWMVLPDKKKR